MITQSQRDAHSLRVLTTYDKVFDYWVSHEPRGSKFGGSGVEDTIPRRASTDKAHATATESNTGSDAKQEETKGTYHANDVLDNAHENAARRVETFRLEEPLEDVLVRFLQNAYTRVGPRFIEPLPDECPFCMLP